PDPVAEDDDVLAVVVWRESPADRGGDAQHAEEVCVHTGPGEPRGIPRAGERSCATRVPRDALERALTLAVVQPLPVDQSRRRVPGQVLWEVRYEKQPIGVGKREWPKQHAVDDTEHCAVRSDRERECEHCGHGERRRPPQRTNAVSDVLDEPLERDAAMLLA